MRIVSVSTLLSLYYVSKTTLHLVDLREKERQRGRERELEVVRES